MTIGVLEFRSLYLDTDWVTLSVCHWISDAGNGGHCEDLPPNDRYGNSSAGILVDQYALASGYGFAPPFYAPAGEYRLVVFHHLYEWSGPEYSYVVSVEHPR